MSSGQRGSVIAGVWLVALGAVFLVQQLLDMSWSQAWPLFLVMAGVGLGASTVIGLAGRRVGAWTWIAALVWPLLLVGIGVLLFVDLAGLADIDAVEFLATWWPVALIVLGIVFLIGAVWPRSPSIVDQLSVPAAGATSGEVILKFGAGRLEVGRGSPGVLVSGTFQGGVRRRDLGPGRVELETDLVQVFPGFTPQLNWQVGLAPDLPLALRLEGGASRGDLDLTDLQVSSLVVKTGASDTTVALSREVARMDVRIEAGAAQVRVRVPDGVAARIRSQMGLGSTAVNERRFPRTSDGWASAGFEQADRQAEIRVQGGIGSVRFD